MKNLNQYRKEELEEELDRRTKLERPKAYLSCEGVRDIREHCESLLNTIEKNNGYPGKDYEYFVFETVMEAVYGPIIWDWWKKNVNF